MILGQVTIGYEKIQGGKPPTSGHDFIFADFLALLHRLRDDEIVNQPLGCDQSSKLLNAAALFLANVQGG